MSAYDLHAAHDMDRLCAEIFNRPQLGPLPALNRETRTHDAMDALGLLAGMAITSSYGREIGPGAVDELVQRVRKTLLNFARSE